MPDISTYDSGQLFQALDIMITEFKAVDDRLTSLNKDLNGLTAPTCPKIFRTAAEFQAYKTARSKYDELVRWLVNEVQETTKTRAQMLTEIQKAIPLYDVWFIVGPWAVCTYITIFKNPTIRIERVNAGTELPNTMSLADHAANIQQEAPNVPNPDKPAG